MIPVQSLLTWKAYITLIHLLAISTTLLRFEHRRRTRRLWWDDYAALMPAFFECSNLSIMWLRMRHFDPTLMDEERNLKVTLSFLSAVSFISTNWWSRISLALAVVRIIPVWSKSRFIVLFMVFLFFLNWIALVTSVAATCAINDSWQFAQSDILICGPGHLIALGSSITDMIGDILLVAFPWYRLRNLTLPNNQRRLVQLVFSTSLLTLMAAIGFCVVSYSSFLVGPGALVVWLMTCQIQAAVSLVVCNLLVLIPWGYRVFAQNNDMEAGDTYVTPHWNTRSPQGREISSPLFEFIETQDTNTSSNEPSTASNTSFPHHVHILTVGDSQTRQKHTSTFEEGIGCLAV